jgi:hypothetical protein
MIKIIKIVILNKIFIKIHNFYLKNLYLALTNQYKLIRVIFQILMIMIIMIYNVNKKRMIQITLKIQILLEINFNPNHLQKNLKHLYRVQ